ncbi:hypothetical protein GCM10017083_47330 [Thalassobaculum fulvum]|uniref:Uncharacterized protein n=1 Tax=Thalassobaculum fulvum TaxID=1633335 RepID=A0A918XX85_9PROT|nr:hypothetical protein GCM10017083_47330 [Thalassobaculum fulvum]
MSDIPSASPPSGSPPAPSSSPQTSGQQAGSSQAAPAGGQGGSAQAAPQASQPQPVAAQAPGSPARAPELPPDLARAAAGTTVEGLVRQAAADGRVTVRTAQGDVRLELSRAQVAQLLKPGTPVTVEIRNPGTQPPIVQLTVRGAPTAGTGGVPTQAATQPAVTTGTTAPAPTVPLAVGRIVQATVVPGPAAQSAASAVAAQSSRASVPPAPPPGTPTPGTPTPTTPGGAPAPTPAPSAAVPAAPPPPGAPVVANPGSASTGTTPTGAPPTGTAPSGTPPAATGSPAAPTVQSGPPTAGSSPAPPAVPTATTPAGSAPASGSSPRAALAQPATGPAAAASAAATNAVTNAPQATPATAAATAQAAGGTALPNGAVLTVRVAAIGQAEARPEGAARAVTGLVQTAAGTPGRIAGQIAGLTAAGRPVVESPVGNLALDARADLRLGTRIALDVLASRTAGTPERAAPLSVLAREWPALEATLRVLEEQLGPAGARQAIEAMPRPGPQMTATLLFFMTALRVGDVRAWLGRTAAQALERAGQGRLLDSLSDDFRTLQRAADPSEAGWRSYLIPVAWDERRPIRLLTRRERRDGRDGRSGKPGTAFLVDLDLTNLGPFRLDGLIRNELLDLLIRTTRPLPTVMRRDIKALFDGTLERTGIVGRLSFKASPVMPPLPVDLDAPAAGGTTELTV